MENKKREKREMAKDFCGRCGHIFKCNAGLEVDCPLVRLRARRARMQRSGFRPGEKYKLCLRWITGQGQGHSAEFVRECRVHQVYRNFCVMDSGKFKFCVYKEDLKGGGVVYV